MVIAVSRQVKLQTLLQGGTRTSTEKSWSKKSETNESEANLKTLNSFRERSTKKAFVQKNKNKNVKTTQNAGIREAAEGVGGFLQRKDRVASLIGGIDR